MEIDVSKNESSTLQLLTNGINLRQVTKYPNEHISKQCRFFFT